MAITPPTACIIRSWLRRRCPRRNSPIAGESGADTRIAGKAFQSLFRPIDCCFPCGKHRGAALAGGAASTCAGSTCFDRAGHGREAGGQRGRPRRAALRPGPARPTARSPAPAVAEAPPIPQLPLLAPRTTAAAPQAIAAELRKKAGGKLKNVYAARNFWPLWSISGNIGPEAEALIAYLASADLDGLKPKSYKPDKLQKAVIAARSGDVRAIAKAELELSKALSRYSADLRRLPKRDVAGVVYADPALRPLKKPSEETALRVGAMAPSFSYYVASMSWMSPHYLRMRNMLVQARARGALEDTQRRLRLNLERARFLPGPFARHIVVDAAAGKLYYYQAGRQLGSMKVVVGKRESPTPMMAGMMHYAIVNPYWNVPVDLVQTLTAPKILAGRTLQSMNMEALSDWTDTARVIDAASIDWKAVAAGTRELRVRQLPGPFNSMGKVKFLFPNEMGIYLHDTPERDLLDKEQRHFSNGCIRLEDAPGLGKWLLGKPLTALPRRTEQIVPLPVPVPVYLTYLTASDGPAGLALLDDVYGRDR